MIYTRESMKSVLATLPASFQADRAELLSLLLEKGILHSSPDRPLTSPEGNPCRWMVNSLGFTLDARGADLAARCLLPLLERFDGRQLATYGLIGVPILQSCIMQSGGRYRGLLVRKEPKAYGTMRIIEGEVDPDEPVILVDDSIVSGSAFWEGCNRLHQAGLRVEGGVYLVRFGWQYGVADAQEQGFHIESVFDVHEDLMANMEGEAMPVSNPSKTFPEFQWSTNRAPERLHPAHLARAALTEYLATGKLLRPPERMDADYDSAGGAWVSVCSKANIYDRHAREGFWRFPGEPQWTPAEDVVRATFLTAQKLPPGTAGCALLESSHIAVTFFSALQECTVGEIDNDRHGIVVSSREQIGVMGGALPRMPGISNELRLLNHARLTNGKLKPFEPYMIHRHGVMKCVEPGAPWQPTGVPSPVEPPAWEDPRVCEPIVLRARDFALGHLLGLPETTSPLTAELLPPNLGLLFVTIYIWGRLRGCAGLNISDLDNDLRRLVASALTDQRFEDDRFEAQRFEDERFAAQRFQRFEDSEVSLPDAVAVSVSLLHNCTNVGAMPPQEVIRYVVQGRQALQVTQGQRSGILLPFYAAMHNLSPEEYALEVVDKAGITRPPYNWQRFDCATWLADTEGAGKLEGAFRPLPAGDDDQELVNELAGLYLNYLLHLHRPDGTFYESYEPFKNRLLTGNNLPRLAHAGWVLRRACGTAALGCVLGRGLESAAESTLNLLLQSIKLSEQGVWLEMGENIPSVSEISFLVLALCELPRGDYRRIQARGLADSLWSKIGRHGRIATHFTQDRVEESFQDYFPGQMLLALATAAHEGLTEVDERKLARAFRYYRHRFRYKRDFGQASWLMQAFAAWHRVYSDPDFSALVFEIGDWLLQYQQEKTGAFLSQDQPDGIGYLTAVYLEGIGAAARMAETMDPERHSRYLDAYLHGLRFLYRITIRPGHASVLPNTEYAIGGLRMSLESSFVRTDFVQHGLSAVLQLFSQFTTPGTSRRSTVEALESTAV